MNLEQLGLKENFENRGLKLKNPAARLIAAGFGWLTESGLVLSGFDSESGDACLAPTGLVFVDDSPLGSFVEVFVGQSESRIDLLLVTSGNSFADASDIGFERRSYGAVDNGLSSGSFDVFFR